MANNQQIYTELMQNDACFLVESQDELQQQVCNLLQNKDVCKQTAIKAKQWLLDQNQQQKIISTILNDY